MDEEKVTTNANSKAKAQQVFSMAFGLAAMSGLNLSAVLRGECPYCKDKSESHIVCPFCDGSGKLDRDEAQK